jgi:hypothetical protein
MKTLIIHPSDPTTDFLKPIYYDMKVKQTTILWGHLLKEDVIEQIKIHDRIICMGHGLHLGQFNGNQGLAIDDFSVQFLIEKECIFIWCFADQFVLRNNISALCTGMVISESREAHFFDLPDDWELINKSNKMFSSAMRVAITDSNPVEAFKYLYRDESNPIVAFNRNNFFKFKDGEIIQDQSKPFTINNQAQESYIKTMDSVACELAPDTENAICEK